MYMSEISTQKWVCHHVGSCQKHKYQNLQWLFTSPEYFFEEEEEEANSGSKFRARVCRLETRFTDSHSVVYAQMRM